MSVTQEHWNFSFCGPQNVNSEADEKRRGQMIISDFAKVASLWSNHLKMTHINIHSSMKSMKYVILWVLYTRLISSPSPGTDLDNTISDRQPQVEN